jgi:hypothetical protein
MRRDFGQVEFCGVVYTVNENSNNQHTLSVYSQAVKSVIMNSVVAFRRDQTLGYVKVQYFLDFLLLSGDVCSVVKFAVSANLSIS